MNKESLSLFKDQFLALKDNIDALKASAGYILNCVEKNTLINPGEAEITIELLSDYCQKLELLRKSGNDLAIDIESGMEAIDKAIAELDDKQLLISEREIVLDFLRLTAETEDLISKLEVAKEDLIRKCRMNDAAEKLVPFGYVVDIVKNDNRDSIDDKLDDIEDNIESVGRYIGRAADRGHLIYDADKNISAYLDDSCELLKPEHTVSTVTETEEQEKAELTPVETVPASDTSKQDEQEMADEEVKSESDETTSETSLENEITPEESEKDVNDVNNEVITWADIGLTDESAVAFRLSDDLFQKIMSEKASTKVGAKEFKNDIRKEDPTARRAIIKIAGDFRAVTPEMIGVLTEQPPEKFILQCKKLTDLGYLIENQLENNPEVFTLSPKGAKIFDTKEAAEYIQARRRIVEPLNISDGNSAITAAACSKVFILTAKLASPARFEIEAGGIDDCNFALFGHVEGTDKQCVFTGIFSDAASDFYRFSEAFGERLGNASAVVIVGADSSHAKAVTDWLYREHNSTYPNLYFYYYDAKEEVIYDYLTGDVVENIMNDDPSSRCRKDSEKQGTGVMPLEAEVPNAEQAPVISIVSEESSPETGFGSETPLPEQANSRKLSEKELVEETVDEMLLKGKPYCATAYLYAMAMDNPEYDQYYKALAYAVNDPLEKCQYNSDKIFEVYFNTSEQVDENYAFAASLRNFFYDQAGADYSLRELSDTIKGFDIINNNSKLSSIMYDFISFKSTYRHGVDYYSDYRQTKAKSAEKRIELARARANELFTSYILNPPKERANFRRFLEVKKIIFAKTGDFSEYLKAAADNDKEFIGLIEEFLSSKFIKQGSEVSSRNIDSDKINTYINDEWVKSAEKVSLQKKSADLKSSLRTNLFKQIQNTVRVLCDYVEASKSYEISESDEGYIRYKKDKSKLLNDLNSAVSDIDNKKASVEDGSIVILAETLKEFISRIDGSYSDDSYKYYYIPFLMSDKVLLDDNYLPLFDSVENLPSMSPANRILEHFNSIEMKLEDRLESIFGGEDDYGSADLIVNYLDETGDENTDLSEIRRKLKAGISNPIKQLPDCKTGFSEELDLAQGFGQIDNTVEDMRETIMQVIDQWYEWAEQTSNFGFFYKIIDNFRNKIKEDSRTRAVDLEKNLAVYIKDNPAWENEELQKIAVNKIKDRIKCQNYTAAEDLMNRLLSGDLCLPQRYFEEDYLDSFIKEYRFNSNCAKTNNAKPLIEFGSMNKDVKAAIALVDAWPLTGGHIACGKIKTLLECLGFAVHSVKDDGKAGNGRNDRFLVRLQEPLNGRKENYKHPISIFGSEAENSEFRVIYINGKTSPEALVETHKTNGGKHTIILLNYSLTLAERKELARRTKKDYSGKTFAVIDRIVLVHLARHYSETAINRMLMSLIMPYAAYQPYVSDSSKVMPVEMFMGRNKELQDIESATGVNIVYGGRQLGKSALLRMAQNEIDRDENGNRAVYVDIKGKEYKEAARKVSAELFDQYILDEELNTDDWEVLAREIRKKLRSGEIPYLLLLLDEADAFIASCEEVNYKPFDALKEIQQIGPDRFKFVIAGLRNIVRFNKNVALGNNSVLTHLSSLTVKPFKIAEARELFEEPLSFLGFRFPEDDNTEMLISTIFGTTNYFPGLIQLYCTKLIEAMKNDYAGYNESDSPPYIIKEDHIKKVLADKNLEEQIREKFFITLKADEDDYYYLIALLVAYHFHSNKGYNGTTAEDLLEIAEAYGINKISALSKDKLSALMEEMKELNVFRQNKNSAYVFSRQNFCEMMGSIQQIEDNILECAEAEES